VWVCESMQRCDSNDKTCKVNWFDFFGSKLKRTKQVDSIDLSSVHGSIAKLPTKAHLRSLVEDLELA